MIEPIKENWGRIIVAVLVGIAGSIGAAFLLFKFAFLLLNKSWLDNNFGLGVNFLLILLAFFCCIFFSAMFGGYISSIIAAKNEYHNVWTIIITDLLVFALFGKDVIDSFAMALMIFFISILGGLIGASLGMRSKEKRKIKKKSHNIFS